LLLLGVVLRHRVLYYYYYYYIQNIRVSFISTHSLLFTEKVFEEWVRIHYSFKIEPDRMRVIATRNTAVEKEFHEFDEEN
jgi:hypothetical protein